MLLLACAAGASAAERRVALVIGNSNYQRITALTNPRKDSADVATKLRAQGFEVMERTDVDRNAVNQMLKDFSRMVSGADVALIYYAGHALEHDGGYYLVPTDASVDDADGLKYDMIAASQLKEILNKISGVRIMIFDACRRDITDDAARALPDQPDQAAQRRAAPPARGDITVFATAPLDVAEDGNARNSPFTHAFLRELDAPERDVRRLFQSVSAAVVEATQGRQTPQVSIDLDGDLYLNRTESDLTRWAAIRETTEPNDLRDFIDRFPNSTYRADAQFRLDVLVRVARRLEQRRQAEAEAKAEAEREAARLAAEAAERKRQEEARAEAERVCEAELGTIASALANGSRDALRQLKDRAKCPETGAKAASALATLDQREAAAERQRRQQACEAEGAQIDLLGAAGDRKRLTSIRSKSSCPETAQRVASAIAAIEKREVEAACQDETAKVAAFGAKRQKSDLQQLKRGARCPATASAVDGALSQIASVEAEEQAAAAAQAKRLREEAEQQVAAARAKEEADRQERAEQAKAEAEKQAAAKREREETERQAKAEREAAERQAAADRAKAETDRRAAEAEKQAAAKREREETERQVKAEREAAERQAAADRAKAETDRRAAEAAKQAAAKREREETERQAQAERQEAERQAAADREKGEAERRSAEAEKQAAAALQIKRKREEAEQQAAAAKAQDDADRQRLAEQAKADSERQATAQREKDEADRQAKAERETAERQAEAERQKAEGERNARLAEERQAALAREETDRAKACEDDGRKLEQLRGEGAAGRGRLEALRDATICVALKEQVVAALNAPTAPVETEAPSTQEASVETDAPEQLTRAQQALSRLGCFAGPIDPSRDDETKDALASFFAAKKEPAEATEIDDQILARLEQEPDRRVCKTAPEIQPRPKRPPPAVSEKPVRQKPARAAAPERAPPKPRREIPVAAERPKAAPRPARPIAEAAPKPRSSAPMILGN